VHLRNLILAMETRVASITSQTLPPTLAATCTHAGVVTGEKRDETTGDRWFHWGWLPVHNNSANATSNLCTSSSESLQRIISLAGPIQQGSTSFLASYRRGVNKRFFITVSPTLFPFPKTVIKQLTGQHSAECIHTKQHAVQKPNRKTENRG